MKDGKDVVIRPIRPEDEPLMIEFHEKLSERSVYLRYFQPLEADPADRARAADPRLLHRLQPRDGAGGRAARTRPANRRFWRSAGLSKLHGRDEAELAAVAIDAAQHKGLGTELYRRLIEFARDEKLKLVVSNMLPENREMRALCVRLGFKMFSSLEDNMIRAELEL